MIERIQRVAGKYKYVLCVLLLGVVLMLLPVGKTAAPQPEETSRETFSLDRTQREMETLLGNMQGVGRVKVMLSLESGSALRLASDEDIDRRDSDTRQETQVVKLNRGSGQQEVVITEEIYPTYMGAVIVCDGGDNSKVKLSVVEAVSVLTALPSDRISVVKWEDDT